VKGVLRTSGNVNVDEISVAPVPKAPIPVSDKAVVGVVAYSGLNAALLLLAALVIGLFGCHLIALAILGHYVWRGLDAARKRPLYSIEAVAKAHDVPAAVAGDRRQ